MQKPKIIVHFSQIDTFCLTIKMLFGIIILILLSEVIMDTFNPFLAANLRLTEAGYTRVGSFWSHLATYFPYYRIYCVTEGRARMFLPDRTLELLPGRLYFIPAFSIMGAECEDFMVHHWLHFHLDVTASSYLSVYKPCTYVEQQPGDEEIFCRVRENFEASAQGTNLSNVLAYTSLTKYLFSRFLPDGELSADTARFVPVLQYIDQHLNTNISNAELSDILCLNETYFSNIFARQFGISPKQYILQKRIGAAAAMLLETDKTVKEVAFSFGYDNEMYFYRIFRKITGTTPEKYRHSLRNNNP